MKNLGLPTLAIWALLMVGTCATHANELLVNGQGTLESENSPFHYQTTNRPGYETQTCYLAEQLADMSDGDTIHALTFYPINRICDTIEAVYTVRLLETDLINTDFSFTSTANSTLVYEGQLPYCDGEMRIEFTTPYIYQGSNLVIDFYVKEPSSEGIPNSYFYGSEIESGFYVQAIDHNGGILMDRKQAKMLIEYTVPANQCHKPTDLQLDEVSHTYATISWSRGDRESSWEVSIDSTTTVVSSPSYTISSLFSATFYDKPISIRSICDAGDTSTVRNATLSFVTACYDATIPYVNDFESEVPGTTHPCWYFSNNVSIAANASYAHDGTNYLSLNGNKGGVYAISPKLSRPVKEVAISFYEQEHSRYQYSWVYKNCIVGSITDPSDFSTFTPLDTLPSSQETYQWVELLMNDAPETDYYILFYYDGRNYVSFESYCFIDSLQITPLPTCLPVSDIRLDSVGITTAELSWTPGKDEQEWDVLVLDTKGDTLYNNIADTNYCVLSSLKRDSLYIISAFIRANCQEGDTSRVTAATFTFTTKATCFPVTDIRLVTVTANTARFTWTAGQDEHAWDVLVLSTSGDTLFNNMVTTNRCTVTGLCHRTPYSIVVQVRANCGDGDLSRVTQEAFSFETPISCGIPLITMPYKENFESTSEGTLPLCWTKIVPVSWGIYTCVGTSYGWNMPDPANNFHAMIYQSSSYDSYTILPKFSKDVRELQITLWTWNSDITLGHGSFIIGAMSDPDNTNTFFPIDTLPQNHQAAEHLVYLDLAPSGYKYIAILYKQLDPSLHSSIMDEALIDNVVVDYGPGCLAIEDIRLDSVGSNNAIFTWTPKRPDPYGYEVTIRNEYDNSVLLSDTVYTPSVEISGLDFSSEYRLHVSVATICQPGNSAQAYTETFLIKTECQAADSIYSEDFEHFAAYPYKAESISTPNCWKLIRANAANTSQRIYVTNTASYMHQGKQSLLFEYSYDRPSYAVMPEMNINLSRCQISLYYHLIGSYHPGRLTLGYFPKNNFADTAFVVITSLPYTTSWNSLKNYRLENVPADVRLALKYHTTDLPNGCNMTDAGIAIDDILIEKTNDCHPPLRILADSVTSHSVQIHWQPKYEEDTHFNVTILHGQDTLYHAENYPDTVCKVDNLQSATYYYLECSVSTACSEKTSDPLQSSVRFTTENAPDQEESITPVWYDGDHKATKFIRNGQLFILRDGRVYTVFGTIVDEKETDIFR